MSVLNQMLRDLERRRGQTATTNPAMRDLREPPEAPRRLTQRLALPGLIALVVLLSLALAWQLLADSSGQPIATQRTTAPAPEPVARSAEPESRQEQRLPGPAEKPPDTTPPTTSAVEQPPTVGAQEPTTPTVTPEPQVASRLPAQPQDFAQVPGPEPAPDTADLQASQTPVQIAATPEAGEQAIDAEGAANQADSRGVRRSDHDDPLERALSHWQAGRYEQAERLLAQQLEQRPDWHQARLHQAQLMLQQQRSDAAIELLQAGLQLDPAALELRGLLARSQQGLGQAEAAIATLEAAPVLDRSEALLLLAALYQQQQSHAQAEQRYRQAVELDASQGRGWAGLAISLEALGEAEQALQAWQQALARSDLPAGLRRYGRERIDTLGRG